MNNKSETKDKKCFDTIDGATLMSTPLQPLRFVVDTLISQGLHVLAGSPKVGKSWLALWLSVTVAKGEPVWGMKTRQGTALYLCLEDSRLRIQNRLFEIMEDAPPCVHFCTEGFIIGDGLEERIESFIEGHPDTVLIIIDTLQMVRGTGYDNTYANDYRDLSILKKLGDKHGVAILLIHHLRKEGADDVFNRISGTTGVQGAVDSSFTLIEDKRGSGKAKLSCIGRDIEYREIVLERNEDNVWEMVSDSREQPELLGDTIISLLSVFMKSVSHFIGTPTELTDALCSLSGEKISPKKISQRILQNREALMDAGITFDIRRSNGKRLIELTRADGDDSADKKGTYSDTPNIDPVDPVCGGMDTDALPLGGASKASGYTPATLSGALPHTQVTKGA
ncbi:MAG: AAA family ATPase [Firmicutes bacterium]|nr:AAA family ATPase [Bacillota bacterium]